MSLIQRFIILVILAMLAAAVLAARPGSPPMAPTVRSAPLVSDFTPAPAADPQAAQEAISGRLHVFLAHRRRRHHHRRHVLQPAAQPAPVPSPAPMVTAGTAPAGDVQAYAESLVGPVQFGCLQQLWDRESGWRWDAANPSGAYGIPQALPGDKMAVAGSDWQTNPFTQVKWGVLDYIDPVYGSACNAWQHEEAAGWY